MHGLQKFFKLLVGYKFFKMAMFLNMVKPKKGNSKDLRDPFTYMTDVQLKKLFRFDRDGIEVSKISFYDMAKTFLVYNRRREAPTGRRPRK